MPRTTHSGIAWILFTSVALAADTPLESAMRQAQAGNCAAAVATLQALVNGPSKPEAGVYGMLANCQFGFGQVDAGVKTLRDGIKVYPAAASLERFLGEVLFRREPRS